MDKTRDLIANMVSDMRFDRKKRVSKKTKAEYSALQNKLETTIKDLRKLHVRLWHADYKKDYHSLSLDEAECILKEIKKDIDSILEDDFKK